MRVVKGISIILQKATVFLLAMTFMLAMLSADVNIFAGENGIWYDNVEGIEGGGVQFDKTTGTITFIGKDVTIANIPEEIDGTKVRALGDWSLQNNQNLVKVTFPEGLEKLGQGTLTGTGIKEVIIPGSVKSLGDWSFQECDALEKVVIEEGFTSIGQGCFRELKNLRTVELPSTLKQIDNYAFRYDDNLEFLTMGGKEINSLSDLEKAGVKLGEHVFVTAYAVHKDFSDPYKTSKWFDALHKVELSGDYVEDIFAIAESQYGYHEGNSFDEQHGNNTKGKGDYAEYNFWWGEPATHWCGEFAGWCIAMASVPTEIIDEKYVTDEEHQYSWRDTVYAGGKYKIKKGDILRFAYDGGDHVVIVDSVKQSGNKILLSSRDGNNGNAVGISNYEINAKTGTTIGHWEDENGYVEVIYGPDWNKVKNVVFYNVIFDANDGKTDTKNKKLSDGAYFGLMPEPTRDGYDFDGWYTAKDGGEKITSYRIAKLNDDISLYAHWTKNGEKADLDKVTVSVDSKTIMYSDLKKEAKTVTIFVNGSSGKIKYVNKSASKLKKYISVSKNGEVTFSKGAPKGIYKIKVTVGKTANNPKTVQTIKIRVK